MDPEGRGGRENEKLQRFLDHPLRQAELVALASRQHAVFSLEQLLGLGWTKGAGLERARAGHLHRIHLASTRAGTSHSRPLPIPRVRSPKLLSRSPRAPLGARWSNRDREPRAALLLPPPTRSRGWFRVEPDGLAGFKFRRPDGRPIADAPRCEAAQGAGLVRQHLRAGLRLDGESCKPISAGDRLDYGLAIDSLMNRARASPLS